MLVGLRIADERQNGVKLSVLLIKIKTRICFSDFYRVNIIVKLLAKSKLKSLPYNHTDHPPTTTHNFKSSLNKSIQVLHQQMRYC